MTFPVIAYIDLPALHYNLRKIKAIAPNSKIIAMVKREAYGHGAVEVARSIEHDIAAFGVTFVQEALQLYKAGIKKTIVVLSGFFDAEDLKIITDLNFSCVVHNFEQLDILAKTKLARPLQVWLKIDTGMHRLGFQPSQVPIIYQKLLQNEMVHKPLRLLTHFSDADNVSSTKTAEQITCFQQTVKGLEGEWCLANSPAIFSWPASHGAWIRPGIALYGISPYCDKTGVDLGLKPVMTLSTRIIAIHDLAAGATIGYGSAFRCPEEMRVGIATIGYGDGYPHNAKSGTPVLVNGNSAQLVGRVAMDMIGIDLRLVPEAKVGAIVTLWGRGLPIERVAASTGEYQYELVSRLTSRVHYKFQR
jgi:alanine racemase